MQVQSNTKVTVNLFLFHSSLSFSLLSFILLSLSVVYIIFLSRSVSLLYSPSISSFPFSSLPFYSRSHFVGEPIEIDLLMLFPGAKHDVFSISLPLRVAFEISFTAYFDQLYYFFNFWLLYITFNKLFLTNNFKSVKPSWTNKYRFTCFIQFPFRIERFIINKKISFIIIKYYILIFVDKFIISSISSNKI